MKSLFVALLALLPLTGCASPEANQQTTITVLAASSLTDTFTTLADEFEAAHPGVQVRLSFGSSATLAQQAVDGAPADVLATADSTTMQSAAAAQASPATTFASNTMVLVTPAANPAGIQAITDLDRPDVAYVICVDTAPCGKVAAALLSDNQVTRPPVSFDVDVKAVLASVTSDEADAGLVYATDAVAAGSAVRTIQVPRAEDEVTSYWIAPLQQSEQADLAQAFVDLITSATGRQVLADAGFGPAGPATP